MMQFQSHTFFTQDDLDAAHREGVAEGSASLLREIRQAASEMYPLDIVARSRVERVIDKALRLR